MLITYNQLKYMTLIYASTSHGAQGTTIEEPYIIFDSNIVYCDRRWLWTSITRAMKLNNITIFEHSVHIGYPPDTLLSARHSIVCHICCSAASAVFLCRFCVLQHKMNSWDLPKTEEDAVRLLQNYAILPSKWVCREGHEMTLSLGSEPRWRCCKRSCRFEVRLRSGNWLEGIRLPLTTVVKFIYGWATETSSLSWCERELHINHCTAISMNTIMGATCAQYMNAESRSKIGGTGLIVEVDETLFSKRQSNKGRIFPEQWVFGGVCRDTNQCFLVCVPDRSAQTLMQAITDNVNEGTTIYSDCWKGYSSSDLQLAGFQHCTVNHTYHFVHPETGAHTQNIERLWGSLKWRNKKQRGTKRDFLDSYFIEFLWRRRHIDVDPFEAILRSTAVAFSPLKPTLKE